MTIRKRKKRNVLYLSLRAWDTQLPGYEVNTRFWSDSRVTVDGTPLEHLLSNFFSNLSLCLIGEVPFDVSDSMSLILRINSFECSNGKINVFWTTARWAHVCAKWIESHISQCWQVIMIPGELRNLPATVAVVCVPSSRFLMITDRPQLSPLA